MGAMVLDEATPLPNISHVRIAEGFWSRYLHRSFSPEEDRGDTGFYFLANIGSNLWN
jgi:hypothetical protein